MSERPSDVSEALAAIVVLLPEQDRRDLKRMLSRRIAVPHPALMRGARLGLLVELLDGQGTFPTSSDYGELRRSQPDPEAWPDHSTLSRAYGSWLAAVTAAMTQLHTYGKPPSYQRFTGYTEAFSVAEMLAAVRGCRDALAPWPDPDDWPRASEYSQYRALARKAAALAGAPMPRLPATSVLLKHLGDWQNVARQARVEREIA